jgi:hypothetical protein
MKTTLVGLFQDDVWLAQDVRRFGELIEKNVL